MSSEKFESLEEDLISIIDDLRLKIERKIQHYVGEEKKSAIRQCERNLEEAAIIIQDMESEAKIAPISYRTQMLGKIRNFRGDLEQMTRSLKKDSLLGLHGSDNYGFDRDDRLEASQRAKLLQGHQSLQRASESIARSQQISAETDQIGVEIIDELGQQRESLIRTRERLSDTDANLGRSRKILKGMARRLMTNKMILAVIIVFEFAVLGGLTYWKFFS